MKKISIKKSAYKIVLVILLTGLFTDGISQSDVNVHLFEKESSGLHQWSIKIDAGQEIFTVIQTKLGVVLKEIRLCMIKNNELVALSDWEVDEYGDKIVINTTQPEETTWEFIITKDRLIIRSSADSGVITAVAPASAARIPARLADQDNGVIYTSLGFVSAKNIYCLFDRKTNIIIQFPKHKYSKEFLSIKNSVFLR